MKPARPILPSALLFVSLVGLPACSSCEGKKDPVIVVVDDGGAHPRAFHRPMERPYNEGGIPQLRLTPRDVGAGPTSPTPGQ